MTEAPGSGQRGRFLGHSGGSKFELRRHRRMNDDPLDMTADQVSRAWIVWAAGVTAIFVESLGTPLEELAQDPARVAKKNPGIAKPFSGLLRQGKVTVCLIV